MTIPQSWSHRDPHHSGMEIVKIPQSWSHRDAHCGGNNVVARMVGISWHGAVVLVLLLLLWLCWTDDWQSLQ